MYIYCIHIYIYICIMYIYISTRNWNYTPKCGLLQPWVARTRSWWNFLSFPCQPCQGNVQQQYIHEQHLQHRQRSGAKLWLCGHPRRLQLQLPSGYVKIASENDHRNSGFPHKKWWFSIAMLNYQRVPIPDFESPKQSFLSLRLRINGIPQKGPQAFPNMVYNWEIRANQHPKSEKRMDFHVLSEQWTSNHVIPSGNLPIENGGSFHSYVNVDQRLHSSSPLGIAWNLISCGSGWLQNAAAQTGRGSNLDDGSKLRDQPADQGTIMDASMW